MGLLDAIFKPILKTLKQPVESFVRLETADSDYVLVGEDGSLISLLRIDGSYQIIGRYEYERIISDSVVKFGSKFDKSGHALQIYFARNPDLIKAKLKTLLEPTRNAANNAGLDINDIFDEKEKHLAKFLASEEIYFVLWSRPSALTKSDFAREMENSRKNKWVVAPDSQNPLVAMASLRTKHSNFTSSILSSLNEVGIKSEMLEVHDALRTIRINLYQSNVNSAWSPCLPGDPIPVRAPEKRGDLSDILWPTLGSQLANFPAKVINDHVVEMGNYIWAGIDLILAPQEPTPFPALLNRLNEDAIPFRVSYLVEGGGVEGMAMQSFLVSLLSVTNSVNKQIKDSIEGLEEMSKSEPIVKMRMSFATWAPKGQMDKLESRISGLIQAIESWGYAQASYVTGDPLDCVMSSALGIACASTAPPMIAPLYEVLKLFPWQRGASPFRHGSILLRTADGRVWPYQTGTNITTTWFDLVFAQPGGGKSVLMNSLNLGTCLSIGVSELPFIAVIDIGPSSSGLISLIRDALPPEKRYQAVSYRLQMSQSFAINPFDTKLGMRVPQATERSFLIELINLLCTPPGHKDAYDGIPQLASMVVDEMYRWRSDSENNAEPRPYLPRVDIELDKIIADNKIVLGKSPYWWDVVDALFDLGLTYEAGLAQRYAVPTLGDAVAAARRPQIRNLLKETTIGAGSEGVIHAFERMITSAVREFPILSTVTRFSLNETRICSLDLADVCPQGDATADRQTAIMYMLARHVLVTPWWINEEALVQMPPKYRPYHEQRLRNFAETPKRLCYDEFHRTSSSKSVRGQLVRDVREGRKRGVQIVLASQMLQDFDDDMVDLATGVWILGAAISDSAIDDTQKTFGLTETARWIIRHRLTGPKASGAPCLFVLATTDGKYEQFLINTLGPIELWAFSTSSEDVAIRNRLYHRLGAAPARKLLGQFYPGGSARNDIRRRVAILAEKGESMDKASVGAIIEQITDEITNFALERLGIFEKEEDEILDESEDEGTNAASSSASAIGEAATDKRDELRPKKYTKGVIGGVEDEEQANRGSTHLIEKTLQAAKAAEEEAKLAEQSKLESENNEIEQIASIEPEPMVEPQPIQEPVEQTTENINPEPLEISQPISEEIQIEPIPELEPQPVVEEYAQESIQEPIENLQIEEEPAPQMAEVTSVVESEILVEQAEVIKEPQPEPMAVEELSPVQEAEQVPTQEPIVEPEPFVENVVQEPAPQIAEAPAEPVFEQSVIQEPVLEPQPQYQQEPIVEPETVLEPQPQYQEQVVEPEPTIQEPVVEPEIVQQMQPIEDGSELGLVLETNEPEVVLQQIAEPQPVQEPVPVADDSGLSLQLEGEAQQLESQPAQAPIVEPEPVQEPVQDMGGLSLEQPQEPQTVAEPEPAPVYQEPMSAVEEAQPQYQEPAYVPEPEQQPILEPQPQYQEPMVEPEPVVENVQPELVQPEPELVIEEPVQEPTQVPTEEQPQQYPQEPMPIVEPQPLQAEPIQVQETLPQEVSPQEPQLLEPTPMQTEQVQYQEPQPLEEPVPATTDDENKNQ